MISISGNWPQFGSPGDQNPLHAFSKSPGQGSLSPISNNHLPGLASLLQHHVSNSSKIAPIGKDTGRVNNVNQIFHNSGMMQGAAYQHSHSFTEQKFDANPGPLSPFESNPNSSGIETLSGPQFLWGSPGHYSEHANSPAWQTSSVGHPFSSSGQGLGSPYTSRHGSFLGSLNRHHVGSAPSGVPLERQFGFFPESPVAFAGMALSGNNVMNIGTRAPMSSVSLSGNMTETGSPSFRMMALPRHAPIFLGNGSYPGPGATSHEGLGERGRSRLVENSGNQIDSKKQYQLDLDKIISGEDTRTTLMIKNIPNK